MGIVLGARNLLPATNNVIGELAQVCDKQTQCRHVCIDDELLAIWLRGGRGRAARGLCL